MGLCLHVFDRDPDEDDEDDPEELAECDLGPYSDFGCFRDTVVRHLDARLFPVLLQHSDSEGEWTLAEIPALERELGEIAAAFKRLPPEDLGESFEHTREQRRQATSLYECFHTVEGDNLFEALLELCLIAKESGRPITFM